MGRREWKVVDRKFVRPGKLGTMQASCHHRRGPGFGACGGCYARLAEALHEIERRPLSAESIVKAVFRELILEGVAKP